MGHRLISEGEGRAHCFACGIHADADTALDSWDCKPGGWEHPPYLRTDGTVETCAAHPYNGCTIDATGGPAPEPVKVQHHGFTVIPSPSGCLCGMPDATGDIGEGGDCRSIGCDPCCIVCGPDDEYCPEPSACAGRAMDATVTAAELVEAIRAELPDDVITIEQTGGGTATVYVNPRDPSGVGDDFGYDLAIGPGAYDYGTPSASTFHRDELSIGSADVGHEAPTVEAIAEYVRTWKVAQR